MKKRYIVAAVLTLAILIATYKFWLIFKSAHSAHFDFYPFVIILVISYLGTLKLTDYLADFKYIKHQSRIEIVFLLIFFILLFIPMCHINQDVKSKKENRKLAVYKPLFQKHQKINYNFGNDFDAWYNDRFNLRYPLFCFYNNIIMKINPIFETSKAVFNQQTNWMFSKWHFISNDKFLHRVVMDKEHNTALEKLNIFCKTHNIKLYLLLVPYQPQLYPDAAAPYYAQYMVEDLNNNIQVLQNKTDVNIIYPYNELKNGKQFDYVYFKTDHHWTDYGAFIGYQKLMSEIQKDFPELPAVKEQDYNIFYSKMVRKDWDRIFESGDHINRFFPFLEKKRDKILDTEYKYYEHKDKDNLEIKITNVKRDKHKDFYYPIGADLRVLQIGTSMNENLTQFTPYTFKNVRYIRLNGVKELNQQESFKLMKYYKQKILDYKPDILILCITCSNLFDVNNFFVEAE